MTRRYYIPNYGPKESAIRTGLAWLLSETAKGGRAYLANSTKANFKDNVVADLLGERVTKALLSDEAVKFGGGTVRLLTTRSSLFDVAGPVLVPFPPRGFVEQLDDCSGLTAMLVIPWAGDDMDWWVSQWEATPLQPATASAPATPVVAAQPSAPPPLEPVVAAALHDLTTSINLSTGLAHPSDHASAIAMFKLLCDNGHRAQPEDVRAHLVAKENWKSDDANKAADLWAKIAQGRQVKTRGRGSWSPQALEGWRQASQKK